MYKTYYTVSRQLFSSILPATWRYCRTVLYDSELPNRLQTAWYFVTVCGVCTGCLNIHFKRVPEPNRSHLYRGERTHLRTDFRAAVTHFEGLDKRAGGAHGQGRFLIKIKWKQSTASTKSCISRDGYLCERVCVMRCDS